MAIRAAEKVWPTPTTREDQIKELEAQGLIQPKDLSGWHVPSEHRVPYVNPGDIVLFLSFVRVGHCLPASPFIYRFLNYFSVSLNHLTLNRVLHLSVFIHVCEAFLGIPLPSLSSVTSSA
jgi:hypothetical protein